MEERLEEAQKDISRVEEVRLRFQSDLEVERSMGVKALEELQKEKDLLVSQFQVVEVNLREAVEKSERITCSLIRIS